MNKIILSVSFDAVGMYKGEYFFMQIKKLSAAW